MLTYADVCLTGDCSGPDACGILGLVGQIRRALPPPLARAAMLCQRYTQFTCFTSAEVQILTQCYAKAAAEDPANYYAWQCLAVLESKSGDSDAARALFKKCTGTQFTCFTSTEQVGGLGRRSRPLQEVHRYSVYLLY
jgi:hypothetical protein